MGAGRQQGAMSMGSWNERQQKGPLGQQKYMLTTPGIGGECAYGDGGSFDGIKLSLSQQKYHWKLLK